MPALKACVALFLCLLAAGCDATRERNTVQDRLAGSWILDTAMDLAGNRTNAFRNQIGSVSLSLDNIGNRESARFRLTIKPPDADIETLIEGDYRLMANARGTGILLDHPEFGGLSFTVNFEGADTLLLTTTSFGRQSLEQYGIDFDFDDHLIFTFQRR